MDLKQRFQSLWTPWIANEAHMEQLWSELTDKYNEPHRHYHNLEHLRTLFIDFDRYKAALAHPDELACALFYHDIIYDIWSKKNELKSAELAKGHLASYQIGNARIERIFHLIMVTKDHTPKTNTDEKWMIDFDLGILGQSWDRYRIYTQQIRKEYSAVPGFMYRKGRKKVLQYFLNKSSIYQTPAFISAFEKQARANLSKELIHLQDGSLPKKDG